MAWVYLGIAGLLEVLWAYMLKVSENLSKPVEATIAFPDRHSRIELTNDPVTEVVTLDNAPWWANRLAKARRMDERSAGRLLEALGA